MFVKFLPSWREHSVDYFLNLNAVAKFDFYN
jgi:hypothetical protein